MQNTENPTTRTPVRSIEIAAVADDEILAFTRPGWGKGEAMFEAAKVAEAEGVTVRLIFQGEATEIPSDYFDE